MNGSKENYFVELAKINVNEHVERKGQFSYLSWPFAVSELRKFDPTATWTVLRFEGLPYLKTECGYFVEVAVTIQSVTLSQIHPVLDSKNKVIFEPNAFDINTSIQRCLVKAIASHGIGLYIYAGEDLPVVASSEEKRQGVGTDKTTKTPAIVKPVAATGFITPEQIARIKALLAETGKSEERLRAFFRVNALTEIKAADYDRVISTLENAKRRAA
jgi:hypothetical protein